MDSNPTINGLNYSLIYSDKTGSLRREIARGASLPTELLIKHQDYVDSATKVAGRRSVVRFDHYMTMTDGAIRPVSLYVVLAAPKDALVGMSVIQALADQVINLLAGTTAYTNALSQTDEILGRGDQ